MVISTFTGLIWLGPAREFSPACSYVDRILRATTKISIYPHMTSYSNTICIPEHARPLSQQTLGLSLPQPHLPTSSNPTPTAKYPVAKSSSRNFFHPNRTQIMHSPILHAPSSTQAAVLHCIRSVSRSLAVLRFPRALHANRSQTAES